MNTHVVKVHITAEDVYNKLSDENKKRFNKAIITDVTRDADLSVGITCVLVNDCPVEEEKRCKNCKACMKGFFKSQPDKYVCIGVKKPFIIGDEKDIDRKCSEYQ